MSGVDGHKGSGRETPTSLSDRFGLLSDISRFDEKKGKLSKKQKHEKTNALFHLRIPFI